MRIVLDPAQVGNFRCDLCGKFRKLGVTESDPESGRETKVCSACVRDATALLLDAAANSVEDTKP